MSVNLDFEGELEIYPAGYGSSKYKVAFCINYDFIPEQRETRSDPAWSAEASVNSVVIHRNGEPVDCPAWLEEMILDAIDEETLCEHATEDADAFG